MASTVIDTFTTISVPDQSDYDALNATITALSSTVSTQASQISTLQSQVAALTGGGSVLPTGGAIGQVLAKNSVTNFDCVWVTPSAGGGSGTSPIVATGHVTLSGTTATINDINPTGITVTRTATGTYTISLPFNMADTNYQVLSQIENAGGALISAKTQVSSKTISSFVVEVAGSSSLGDASFAFAVMGVKA